MAGPQDLQSSRDAAVHVRPAHARRTPALALKIYGGLLAAVVFGLGLWKAWELILLAQAWYGLHRNVVNAVLVLALLLLVVLTVVALTAKRRKSVAIQKRVDHNAKKIAAERRVDILTPEPSPSAFEGGEVGRGEEP